VKVAIVHDWLVTYAGAERVLEQMLAVYPDAHLYSLIDFMPDIERGFLGGRRVHTSFLQRIPGARRGYRQLLPLMPFAIEQFDLSAYDLVLSSSHAIAKGVLTGPNQLHVCMCYSPVRWAWDLQHQYLRETGLDHGPKGMLARWMLHRLRLWDVRTANGVDHFIAISHFIAQRIWKYYRRKSTVIYPPVDVERFTPNGAREDFYVTASRMVPYKRMDLIVEAFASMPARRLIIIGDGPEFKRVKAGARSNVTFLGYQPFEVLRDHLRRARAFVFAAEEDFGIAPLEAQACGTPVIAYERGGVRETVPGLDSPDPTGIFFPEQTASSIIEAVETFERKNPKISPAVCRTNALRFAPERFRSELVRVVGTAYQRFQTGGRAHDLGATPHHHSTASSI
jgi:glycosyltransferase involved in cell wall biosynthesis